MKRYVIRASELDDDDQDVPYYWTGDGWCADPDTKKVYTSGSEVAEDCKSLILSDTHLNVWVEFAQEI